MVAPLRRGVPSATLGAARPAEPERRARYQMRDLLKRGAAHLPRRWQQEMKRIHFGRALARGRFSAGEAEWDRLGEWVKPGGWAVDVGANVGHYTARLSELVGSAGRVIAFEPVPETFELLSANMARLPTQNVTLINAALSGSTSIVTMSVPKFETGLKNYYMAQVTAAPASGADGRLSVLALPLDALDIPQKISLVKIDAEGHERSVLDGMVKLLHRDHPALIIEDNDPEVESLLAGVGYRMTRAPGSSNCVYLHDQPASPP